MTSKHEWLAKLDLYLSEKHAENQNLEFKRADALGKNPERKKQIAKEVSAMANAAGGTVIFGIKEIETGGIKHAGDFDPVDAEEFAQEWLDQVIADNTEPPVKCEIVQISVDAGVVYVVEIPQGTEAHQVTASGDLRYWQRLNTVLRKMRHFQILDVMNRRKTPDVIAEMSTTPVVERAPSRGIRETTYRLNASLINQSTTVVAEYQRLEITFPFYGEGCVKSYGNELHKRNPRYPREMLTQERTASMDYRFVYRSEVPMLPKDNRDLNSVWHFTFAVDDESYRQLRDDSEISPAAVSWITYADAMLPKGDSIPLKDIIDYDE